MPHINVHVSEQIFQSPDVKQHIDEVFDVVSEKITNRFNAFKSFTIENGDKFVNYDSISYEDVLQNFKDMLFQKVAVMAVQSAFESENHDVGKNIIQILSADYIENEVMGYTMVEAFSNAMDKIPANCSLKAFILQKDLKKYMIVQLEKYFFGHYRAGSFITNSIRDKAQYALEELEKENM